MNILITAPSLDPNLNVSGVSTVVNTIIEHNNRHNFFHYLLGRSDKTKSRIKWVTRLINQLLLFPLFVRRNKIDLVHQNLPFDPKGLTREYIINIWCKICKVPVVLHVHGGVFLMNGTNNWLYKVMINSIFHNSKLVLVLSELEKQALIEKFNYQFAQVLLNSIDTSLYKTNRERFVEKKPVFLFLGRIHESKGVNEIIEAFKMLRINNNSFRFVLCGTGPLKDYFISECTNILGNDFEYRGVVSGLEKIKIIEESDFFLLPSRYGEGMPMALLETMATGVVPVVTDDASMKIVVQPEINGIRVEKNNSMDLFKKLSEALIDTKKMKLLSKNASKTITEKYDVKNYILQLNEIYVAALKKIE